MVRAHKRIVKGKAYKVQKHSRTRKRPLGTKIRYKTVGRFQTAIDEHGNLRGSRILKTPESKDPNVSDSDAKLAEIKKLDSDFSNRKIPFKEYQNKIDSLIGENL